MNEQILRRYDWGYVHRRAELATENTMACDLSLKSWQTYAYVIRFILVGILYCFVTGSTTLFRSSSWTPVE
jgi:hypothetical protein